MRQSFTIVELLIVIVVISILAAITTVFYGNIRYRSQVASLSAEVNQVRKQLETYKIENGEVYPATATEAELETNPLSTIEYEYNETNERYCLTVSQYGISRFVTSHSLGPAAGSCIGLVGWWPMNESAEDLSTTGNATTVAGAIPAPGQNSQSGAYSFNGEGDYISCGTDIALRPTTAVTLSAWIYLNNDASGRSGIVNYGNGGYWLAVTPMKNAALYMSDTAIENTGAFPTGSWHHLAGSYEDGNLAIYIDGEVVETSSIIKGNIENYGATECLIGSVKQAAGNYFEGSIDDVRIYDRYLTQEEVRDIYREGAF